MKTRRIILGFCLLAGFLAVVVTLMAATAPLVLLPGITSKDENPNGCVDCHKILANKQDYRLTISLAQVKGHPDITKIVKKVPSDCAMCHKAGSNAPALNTLVHKVHYSQPLENPFIATYKGSCLNCHSLDAASGEMKVKSGQSNW